MSEKMRVEGRFHGNPIHADLENNSVASTEHPYFTGVVNGLRVSHWSHHGRDLSFRVLADAPVEVETDHGLGWVEGKGETFQEALTDFEEQLLEIKNWTETVGREKT